MGFDKFRREIASPGSIVHRDTKITVAQMVALFTTEVTLVPAPKSGLTHIFEGAILYKGAGTAYTIGTGGNISIGYTNKSGLAVGAVAPANIFDQTTAQLRFIRPYRAASGDSGITPVNGLLCIFQATANMTVGTNATVTVRCYYRTVPASL